MLSKLKLQITLGLAIMGSSFIFLPNAKHYWQYIVSILILTMGESITFLNIPALLSKFSTAQNRGVYQSLYVIFGSLGRALGPYLGSLIINKSSFNLLFILICGSIFLAAGSMILIRESA